MWKFLYQRLVYLFVLICKSQKRIVCCGIYIASNACSKFKPVGALCLQLSAIFEYVSLYRNLGEEKVLKTMCKEIVQFNVFVGSILKCSAKV